MTSTRRRPACAFASRAASCRRSKPTSSPAATARRALSRPSIPKGVLSGFERLYPFGWLGILCKAPPSSDELIYALSDRGFALVSTRSPDVQRMYLQCEPTDKIENWSDDRIWSEFRARLATRDGWAPKEGEIFSKTVVGMRSFVTEPMQYGRLFLAGDAAHVVPPTGAKGSEPRGGRRAGASRVPSASSTRTAVEDLLERYSETALRRIWKAQRFSWWMTSMLHRFPGCRRVPAQGAGRRTRLRHRLARCFDGTGRELRRPAIRRAGRLNLKPRDRPGRGGRRPKAMLARHGFFPRKQFSGRRQSLTLLLPKREATPERSTRRQDMIERIPSAVAAQSLRSHSLLKRLLRAVRHSGACA